MHFKNSGLHSSDFRAYFINFTENVLYWHTSFALFLTQRPNQIIKMSSNDHEASTSLPSSKLGTQEHWDDVYIREVKNFDEIGDEGEIWFGEDAVERMVDFLEREAEDENLAKDIHVLDLGTGNGHLLFALLELDQPLAKPEHMLGIDYSAPSIDLCKRIAIARGQDAQKIRFEQIDFLQNVESLKQERWNLVCDKGTLDAIALSSASKDKATPISQYVQSLEKITTTKDLFLITSCNFTEQELIKIFKESFNVYHVIPVPSFSFGGQKGSTTVTIAFQRK